MSSACTAIFALIVVMTACGKKGPPLPPLLKVPVAPADLTAQRRAETVDLLFVVPAANTDGTRPANVERVDVYAITSPRPLTDDQIVKLGTKVASVQVKAPRDPDATTEPDNPDEEVDPPEGKGLNQGVIAIVTEELTDQASVPVMPPEDKKSSRTAVPAEGPLLPLPMVSPSRTYVGVGITTRGRKGLFSPRVSVSLAPPPPPPAAPMISYDEKAITLSWAPFAAGEGSDSVLPSTPLGAPPRSVGYNVYEGTTRLTKTALAEPTFADPLLTWGEKRCYIVRTAEKTAEAVVESDASPERCVTPVDTFPPAVPKTLQSVASVGAITLIWEPNTERDLAGYIVLRGGPESDLQPITASPITATQFKDDLAPGTRHVYAVRAVDKAGNASAISNLVEDTAR